MHTECAIRMLLATFCRRDRFLTFAAVDGPRQVSQPGNGREFCRGSAEDASRDVATSDDDPIVRVVPDGPVSDGCMGFRRFCPATFGDAPKLEQQRDERNRPESVGHAMQFAAKRSDEDTGP